MQAAPLTAREALRHLERLYPHPAAAARTAVQEAAGMAEAVPAEMVPTAVGAAGPSPLLAETAAPTAEAVEAAAMPEREAIPRNTQAARGMVTQVTIAAAVVRDMPETGIKPHPPRMAAAAARARIRSAKNMRLKARLSAVVAAAPPMAALEVEAAAMAETAEMAGVTPKTAATRQVEAEEEVTAATAETAPPMAEAVEAAMAVMGAMASVEAAATDLTETAALTVKPEAQRLEAAAVAVTAETALS